MLQDLPMEAENPTPHFAFSHSPRNISLKDPNLDMKADDICMTIARELAQSLS